MKESLKSKLKIKGILILFFDCCRILLQEWVLAGQTVSWLLLHYHLWLYNVAWIGNEGILEVHYQGATCRRRDVRHGRSRRVLMLMERKSPGVFISGPSWKCPEFSEKMVRKNWQLFQKNFTIKKIWRFLHENLTVFTGKSTSSNVPVKTIRFFFTKIVRFSCKSWRFFL